MDLGIVIVSYNTRDLTADCLTSVYCALEAERIEAMVCVVDNASHDGSAEMVHERFSRALLVASDENLGFARGTNVGLERLEALPTPPRYLLLLNPDTIVASDAFGHMLRFMDAHREVDVVGAQLAYGDGSFQHGAFHFPTLWMAFLDFWPLHHRLLDSRLNGRYSRRRYAVGEPFPIDHPLGAALMMRRAALARVGPLDTGYFMYCEEIDWCMRVKATGGGIYCVPQARVVHLEGQSTRQFREKMYIALWRSRFRLFEKHYGPVYRFCVRLITRAGMRRMARHTREALQAGEIMPEEAERRLAAFDEIARM